MSTIEPLGLAKRYETQLQELVSLIAASKQARAAQASGQNQSGDAATDFSAPTDSGPAIAPSKMDIRA